MEANKELKPGAIRSFLQTPESQAPRDGMEASHEPGGKLKHPRASSTDRNVMAFPEKPH